MNFNLKPQGGRTEYSDAPKIDFNKINDQVEADNTPAIVSLIVDLGVHTPSLNVRDSESTEFESEEEANKYLADIVEIKGEKDGAKFSVKQDGDKWVVNGVIYQPKDGQEIAIFADLVDNVVDYGDEIGKKPYRVMLNKSFMGDLKGFSLKAVPPQTGSKVWTFAGNSMLTKLAKATKQEVIIDGSDDSKLNNVGLLLGQSLMVDVNKKKSGDNVYINVGGVSSVPKAIEKTINQDLVTPVGISFDSVTVEDLEKAQLRGNVIKKIKSANNFKGSQIEKALAEFEGGSQSTQNQENTVVVDTDYDDDDF